MYDFAVELKKKHKEVKDKDPKEVGYTLKYIPWILSETVHVYNRHHKRYDFNELLSVAFEASCIAEEKFDPTKGQFTTYARHTVPNALNRYVSSISSTQAKLIKKIQKFSKEYYEEFNCYPAKRVILEELDISEERFHNITMQNIGLHYVDDLPESDASYHENVDGEIMYNKLCDIIDEVDTKQGVLTDILINGMDFKYCSKKLKVTKAEVQSIYDKGLDDLRERLTALDINLEDCLHG